MNDKIHSADVEPAGRDAGHYLMVNGTPIARYSDLQTAINARNEFLGQNPSESLNRIWTIEPEVKR